MKENGGSSGGEGDAGGEGDSDWWWCEQEGAMYGDCKYKKGL